MIFCRFALPAYRPSLTTVDVEAALQLRGQSPVSRNSIPVRIPSARNIGAHRDRLFHSPGPHHPAPQSLLADLKAMPFRHLLAGERRPKSCHSVRCRIPSAFRCTASSICRFEGSPRNLCIATASPSCSILFSSRAHTTIRYSHPLGGPSLRHPPSRARFDHSSPSRSSWLIAIRSHPPALPLLRGTFYFAQLGSSFLPRQVPRTSVLCRGRG